MENPVDLPLSEQEKLDLIEIPTDNDPLKWAKTPIVKVAWMDAVSQNTKYQNIDMDRVIRGYVLETIVGDDKTAFFEHNQENGKEIILTRMKWEAGLPTRHIPEEVQKEVEQTLEQTEDKDRESIEPIWLDMEARVKQIIKDDNYQDDIEYARQKRTEVLDRDQWSWQKSKLSK